LEQEVRALMEGGTGLTRVAAGVVLEKKRRDGKLMQD